MQIPVNKKRIPIVVILGLALTIILTIAITTAIKSEDANAKQSLYIYIGLLIAAVYYTSLSLADYWRTLFNPHAILSIEQDGINDTLSLFSCGKIRWSEISNVRIQQFLKTNFLVIDVHNPESLIAKQSKWKQRTLRGYQKKFGSPVVVSQKRIKRNVEDVITEITSHLH